MNAAIFSPTRRRLAPGNPMPTTTIMVISAAAAAAATLAAERHPLFGTTCTGFCDRTVLLPIEMFLIIPRSPSGNDYHNYPDSSCLRN